MFTRLSPVASLLLASRCPTTPSRQSPGLSLQGQQGQQPSLRRGSPRRPARSHPWALAASESLAEPGAGAATGRAVPSAALPPPGACPPVSPLHPDPACPPAECRPAPCPHARGARVSPRLRPGSAVSGSSVWWPDAPSPGGSELLPVLPSGLRTPWRCLCTRCYHFIIAHDSCVALLFNFLLASCLPSGRGLVHRPDGWHVCSQCRCRKDGCPTRVQEPGYPQVTSEPSRRPLVDRERV